MSTKQRSPGQTAIGVSIQATLLAQIDARAAALGLSRSTYLAQLARADIEAGGPMMLADNPPAPPPPGPPDARPYKIPGRRRGPKNGKPTL